MATIVNNRFTVSATEARVHFGEVLERVADRAEVVIVERHGRPSVAVVPIQRLDALDRFEAGHGHRSITEILDESHAYVRTHLGEGWFEGIDIDDMIDGGRDDVD